jgi:hypothetical protein
VCRNEESPSTGVWLRSMKGGYAPPAAMECISVEGEVGMQSRDVVAGWGGGSCLQDKNDNAGHCQAAVTDNTEMAVEPSWSAVNWFTTPPFSMATAWRVAAWCGGQPTWPEHWWWL